MNFIKHLFRLLFAALDAALYTLVRFGNQRGSITMPQSWQHQFDSVLHSTYQQDKSLLENLLDPRYVHRSIRAAIDHFERLGNVVANDVIVQHGATKLLNPRHSKRACTLISSDAAVALADIDTVRTMVDPQNAYMMTIVAALGRRADKHIIDAAVGNASVATVSTTDATIAYTTQALLSAYVFTATGSSNALALADIIKANFLMSNAGVPSGAQNRIALYSPGQLTNILNITQASSSDFTKNQIHDRGTINGYNWEGLTWIEIADVVDETVTVLQRMLPFATTRGCIFMSRDAVGLSIGADLKTFINERPDMNNEIQVRATKTMAAVRIWEGGVVRINALENV